MEKATDMAKKTTTGRRYDSTRRKQQARQTRREITEAARKLFTERGYAGATMGAIADEAGVAVETIYATFGSKSSILSHLIDVSVVGDDEPVPLLERPEILETEQELDQRRRFSFDRRHQLRMPATVVLVATRPKCVDTHIRLRVGGVGAGLRVTGIGHVYHSQPTQEDHLDDHRKPPAAHPHPTDL